MPVISEDGYTVYFERLLSILQDVIGAYSNDANWFVVRGNSCKLTVVFPITMSPILHICSYPGFFILMKVIHTTMSVYGTNYRW